MTITYNPNNGHYYAVQLSTTLMEGTGPTRMTLRELLTFLKDRVPDSPVRCSPTLPGLSQIHEPKGPNELEPD